MWETICDAWACWSGWKFGANSTEYPYSVIQNTPPEKLQFCQILGLWVLSITEYPPPPENWNLARSFEYFQLQNTPPPPENWNLGRSWDFEYFQLQNTPPPPRKLKFSQILGLWVFSITEDPPPPENWNLARSWDFEYFQLQNNPPPPKIEI